MMVICICGHQYIKKKLIIIIYKQYGPQFIHQRVWVHQISNSFHPIAHAFFCCKKWSVFVLFLQITKDLKYICAIYCLCEDHSIGYRDICIQSYVHGTYIYCVYIVLYTCVYSMVLVLGITGGGGLVTSIMSALVQYCKKYAQWQNVWFGNIPHIWALHCNLWQISCQICKLYTVRVNWRSMQLNIYFSNLHGGFRIKNIYLGRELFRKT